MTLDRGCLRGLRVLVVDDDGEVRNALQTILGLFGAESAGAECAASARRLLAAERFDVLLSDLDMPGEDGYALMRSLRSSRCSGRCIAAAAVTGVTTAAGYDAALAAGFDRIVAKPPDVGALVEAVRELARGAARPA